MHGTTPEESPLPERPPQAPAQAATQDHSPSRSGNGDGDADHGWHPLAEDGARWIRSHPVSLIATVLLVVTNLILMIIHLLRRKALWSQEVVTHSSRLPRMALSMVIVHGFVGLLIVSIVLIAVLALAETRLGSIRTVLVALISSVGGTAAGLGVSLLISDHVSTGEWIRNMPVHLSPLIFAVGPLMASAYMAPLLHRRRILTIGYTAILSTLLFAGNPADYCLLSAAIVGQLCGLAMPHRASPRASWRRGTDHEIRRLLSYLQLSLALGPLVAITSTSHAGPLTRLGLLLSTNEGSAMLDRCLSSYVMQSCVSLIGMRHAITAGMWLRLLIPVAVMTVLAWGLHRGRRLAAALSVIINVGLAVFAALYYLTPIGLDGHLPASVGSMTASLLTTAIPTLSIAVAIALNFRRFPIRTNPRKAITGAAAVGAGIVAAAIGFLAVTSLFPKSFAPTATPALAALTLIHALLPLNLGGLFASPLVASTPLSNAATQITALVPWVTLFVVLLWLLKDEARLDEDARVTANSLVMQGGNSMSFMTTWEGNGYWISPTGRSAIAYRVLHSIALTVTGPIGDLSERRECIRGFMGFCAERSWVPAFYAVHDDERTIMEEEGCTSIHIGTEMVVRPSEWQTRGKKWQDIRTAINKAAKLGIADVLTTFPEASEDVRRQIVEISEQWAETKSLPEMRFTLGGVDELEDPRVALLLAIDSSGIVQGVTSWLPTYRDGVVVGWTLDFMRHRPDSPNGIMEFLIARMAERLRDQGIDSPENAVSFMSLSTAPLAGLDDGESDKTASDKTDESTHPNADIVSHALSLVSDMLEPAYGFRSLYAFKGKFHPVPDPVYVCIPDVTRMPALAFAVMEAYVPSLDAAEALHVARTLVRPSSARPGTRCTARKPPSCGR